MPSVHYNDIHGTANSKSGMMLNDEEEETATLAEPMTVEGAKQLAQSGVSTTPTPQAILNISPGLPTVSPPILSSPRIIHPILTGSQLPSSRSPLLHSLSSPPGATPHPLLIASNLTSPASQFSVLNPGLWASSNISPDEEDISEYPSTVDLQAIRDSPSPEPIHGEQNDANSGCDSEASDRSDSHDEDSSSDDESDSSDSDSSSSNSESSSSDCSNKEDAELSDNKMSKLKPVSRPPATYSDTDSSDSDSDEKGSDSDEDGTSSNDESSDSSDDCREKVEKTNTKTYSHQPVNHTIQQIISKTCKDQPNPITSNGPSQDFSQSYVSPACKMLRPMDGRNGPLQMNTKVGKSLSENSKSDIRTSSDNASVAKKCPTSKERTSPGSRAPRTLIESGSHAVRKKILQHPRCSPTELEKRRIAKSKELDQEFDRLLESSSDCLNRTRSDVEDDVLSSDDLVCSDSTVHKNSHCDKTTGVIEWCVNDAHSGNSRNKLVSGNRKSTVDNSISLNCNVAGENQVKTKISKSPEHSVDYKSDTSDTDESAGIRRTLIDAESTSKSSPKESPSSSIQKTIADTVKIRERKTSLDTASSSGERENEYTPKKSYRKHRVSSKSTEDSSMSDASDELNEKVDLDTEQTQTFSVSENNFNQGRLTMKIAAMKMAKFGKPGLREVTGGGFPTRSDSYGPFEGSDTIPKWHSLKNHKSEVQKVKTAAERKTYIDPVPVSPGTNIKSKKEFPLDVSNPAAEKNGRKGSSSPDLCSSKDCNTDNKLGTRVSSEASDSIVLPNQNHNAPAEIFHHNPVTITKNFPKVKKKYEPDIKRVDKNVYHPNSPEESNQPSSELESYMPSEHNALNVSPDSGIQSVNGSPLHPVGSPHQSPFYSSGLIEAGISASDCQETKGPSEESGGSSLNRSFSPSFSHRDSPSPPTLVPAITPPHLCRSPRYYGDDPDSPPMPVLECEVDNPPWEVPEVIKQSESENIQIDHKETDVCKPKRSRGRPKGSKNLKKPLDQIWSTHTKDSTSSGGSRRKSTKPIHLSDRTPVECKNIDSQASVLPKRGPGRPKKIKNSSTTEDNDSQKHRRLKVKRPVGRPRKQPNPNSVDAKSLPVTLASRKCFSEKIMHKIINEKVRNSEKSDKLSIEGKNEELPSECHDSKDARSEDERGRKTKRKNFAKKLCGDGIPLIEERKKKRGRRKELPAIFGKVYGSISGQDKSDLALGLPAVGSHSIFKKKKKHKKSFKSKHKNIIDPVFLAELETLVEDFGAKCVITKPLSGPLQTTGEAPLPSIFRRRKIVLSAKKKTRLDKVKNNDKESGTEGDTREKLAGKRKKKVQELPKQGRERSEANEQRLPLKKRHRHISTGVSVCSDPPKVEQSKLDSIKNVECKDKFSMVKNSFETTKNIKAENKTSKTSPETKGDGTLTTKKKSESKPLPREQSPVDNLPARFTPLNASHNEENNKKDATYQSMVSTTPKKRHRLETDVSTKKKSDHTIEQLIHPDSSKSTNMVTHIKVEQETDQGVSGTTVASFIENVLEPVVSKSNPSETGTVEEMPAESTHSDSDIPSEHEPLGESDHGSSFSDKEDPVLISPKQKVKKREHRSPKKILESSTNIITAMTATTTVHRKKRRKTNRTGFPTIRRKKKIKVDIKENDSPVVLTSDQAASLDPKVCIEPLSVSDATRFTKIKGEQNEPARPRGRPRKIIEGVKSISESEESKSRKRKEPDEDRILEESRKVKKVTEEEVEESDTPVTSEIGSEPISSDESGKISVSRKKVPRFKKKYLVAGLLSNYYKQDDISQRKNGGTCGRPKLQYEPEKHIHGLLPPPSYCKKQLRETVIDFKLPYDLWWLSKHKRLPGRDAVPSWNYKKVKANVYYDVKPTHEFDIQACNCKKPSKSDGKSCGEDCINRVMFIECSPQTCPVNERCSNQRLQKHENLTCLQKFKTEDKGWGIKASEKIQQGSFIMEYVGEVVSEKEFRHRMQTRYVNDTHHYCLNLDRGMMIDGHRIGSDCRFVNHSCSPNCEMQKWNVNGQYRMALFALKDIPESEELTYDYNFHLFNPAQGQVCKCKEDNCRGVIGGRSQRINNTPVVEEKRKTNGRNKKEASKKRKRGGSTDTEGSCVSRSQFMPMKPLSHQQRVFILAHRCFLLRNLEKIRKSRERVTKYQEKKVEEPLEPIEEPSNKIQRFQTHFTALNTARSVKTRRLAQAEDDPEMTRLAKLAQIFKDIYDKLFASRDDNDKPLATPFMSLPSKKKYPAYYSRVGEPIDLALIEKNISTGHYTSAEAFDGDLMRLFANNLRFFGRNTEIGQMAVGLRKVYSECKLQFKPLLEEVLGEDHLPSAFSECAMNEEFEDEDVIRCVCNLYRDEGTMIQCERCLVWQHCDCMGVDEEDFPEHYLCEECSPRIVSPEVPMTPQPADSNKKKHFITLLRDNLQIKQGDSVYILRDRPTQKVGERRQPAYKLAKDIKLHELLIFKVESLFIDEKGDKYAFGHHYLRPHETFHEPTRKFYANEVIRSPYCEIIALDLIIKHCWVMDLNSYCRGRPIGAIEEHVYVCEFRVDKSAHVFSKISKPKYPICKKPYAFVTFVEKLRPQKTYTPHEVIFSRRSKHVSTKTEKTCTVSKETNSKMNGVSDSSVVTSAPSSRNSSGTRKSRSNTSSRDRSENETPPEDSNPIKEKPHDQRTAKRLRANQVATRLLHRLPTKGAIDLAYLLENNKRQRKKTTAFAS